MVECRKVWYVQVEPPLFKKILGTRHAESSEEKQHIRQRKGWQQIVCSSAKSGLRSEMLMGTQDNALLSTSSYSTNCRNNKSKVMYTCMHPPPQQYSNVHICVCTDIPVVMLGGPLQM